MMPKTADFTRRSALAGGAVLLGAGLVRASKAGTFAGGGAQTSGRFGTSVHALRPEEFGAAGNGIADDTAALAAFAEALGGGVSGRMDGRYRISRAILFQGKRGFELRGTGTIKIADGTPTNETHSALHFRRSSDFLVEGLTVDGNRSNRRPVQDSGHLIRVDSCHRARFRGVTAANGTTDGWYIAALGTGNGPGGGPAAHEIPSDLSFEDCSAIECYRNGMSIIDAFRVVVRGGTYARSHGHYDDTGRGPCAGIDLEPNPKPGWIKERIRDVLIERVTFDGNQGFQLIISDVDGVHDVVVRDCAFLNNKRGAIEAKAAGTQIIRPLIVGFGDEDYTRHPAAGEKRALIDIPANAGGGTVVANPTFRKIDARQEKLRLIYSHGRGLGRNRIYGIDAEGDITLGVYLRAPGDRVDE